MKICLVVFCLLPFYFCLSSCSIPNLESQDCSAARGSAKEFYSFHFGNDMQPSADNLKARERFITPEYYAELTSRREKGIDAAADPFTPFSEKGMPQTFKVGKCKESGEGVADLQIQFYWRDDSSTDQKELHAEMVKTAGRWLVKYVGTGTVQ